MKRSAFQYACLLYLSAAVMAVVFVPGVMSDSKSFSHLLEHLLIIASAALFAYAVERLRQMATSRKRTQ
ncbi:hypothetical protein [Alicyclobacillus acidiphilus]|uniref:hypothetical protein n=1 Tax=Alicyclobacillus acidiphilus TaxID=182455 RepID=UPI00082FE479|nr:hypothetical protein [Alicyclobacillus acidiphilus]